MISVNNDEPFWLSTTGCDNSVSQNRMDLLVHPPFLARRNSGKCKESEHSLSCR